MTRLRRALISFAPPLVYLTVLYQAMRPPKAVYSYDKPTVMTVTGKGGPAILHAPEIGRAHV
jgi:hypothetical protein